MSSAFLIMPPLLVLARPRSGRVKVVSLPVPFVPRSASAGVVVAFAALTLYGAVHAVDVPFVNDFVRLRGTSETTEFTRYVDENLGAGFNPAVIVVEGVEALRRSRGLDR